MPIRVNIEGIGQVRFPDGMSEQDIETAIVQHIRPSWDPASPPTERAPEPPSMLERAGEAVSGAREGFEEFQASLPTPVGAGIEAAKAVISAPYKYGTMIPRAIYEHGGRQPAEPGAPPEPEWSERLGSMWDRAGHAIVENLGGFEQKAGEEMLDTAGEMRRQAGRLGALASAPERAPPTAPDTPQGRAAAMREMVRQRRGQTGEMLLGRATQLTEAAEPKIYGGAEQARIARESHTAEAERVPDNRSTLSGNAKYYVSEAAESVIGYMLPSLAVGIATRSPAAAMAMLGGTTYGSEYSKARADGRSQDEASMDAAVKTAAEVIPEIGPFGVIFRASGARGWVNRAFRGAASEALSEVMTGAVQTAYDVGVLDDDMSATEVAQTLVTSGILGAFMGGPMAAITPPMAQAEGAASRPDAQPAPGQPTPQGQAREQARQDAADVEAQAARDVQIDEALAGLDEAAGTRETGPAVSPTMTAAPGATPPAPGEQIPAAPGRPGVPSIEAGQALGAAPGSELAQAPGARPDMAPTTSLGAAAEPAGYPGAPVEPSTGLMGPAALEAELAPGPPVPAPAPLVAAEEMAPPGPTEAPEPAPVRPRSHVSKGVQQPFEDSRILRAGYRGGLRHMADELVKGENKRGHYVDTGIGPPLWNWDESTNPEWFKDNGWTVDEVNRAVDVALEGGLLFRRQSEIVNHMLGHLSDYSNRGTPEGDASVDYALRKRAMAQAERRALRAGFPPLAAYDPDAESAGEIYAEPTYDPDWDTERRVLSEIATEAQELDAERAMEIMESHASDERVAQELLTLIAENSRGQEVPTDQAVDAGAPGTAAAPAGAAGTGPAATQRAEPDVAAGQPGEPGRAAAPGEAEGDVLARVNATVTSLRDTLQGLQEGVAASDEALASSRELLGEGEVAPAAEGEPFVPERGIEPVSFTWANMLGRPEDLPVPGDPERYGVKAPTAAGLGTRYMLPDGTVWEYKGISAYAADNRTRVNGWEDITRDVRPSEPSAATKPETTPAPSTTPSGEGLFGDETPELARRQALEDKRREIGAARPEIDVSAGPGDLFGAAQSGQIDIEDVAGTKRQSAIETREEREAKPEKEPEPEKEDYFAKAEREIAERKAKAKEFADLYTEGAIFELKHPRRKLYAMVSPDASELGKVRVTTFDAKGFSGHSTHATPREAFLRALEEGYSTPAAGALDKLSQADEWAEGMRQVEEVRKANEKSRRRQQAKEPEKPKAQEPVQPDTEPAAPEKSAARKKRAREGVSADLKEMRELAKKLKAVEGRIAKQSVPSSVGVSRARATSRQANLGKLAKQRDSLQVSLGERVRANLREGRAVPDDILATLGSAIDYNKEGNYEPIEQPKLSRKDTEVEEARAGYQTPEGSAAEPPARKVSEFEILMSEAEVEDVIAPIRLKWRDPGYPSVRVLKDDVEFAEIMGMELEEVSGVEGATLDDFVFLVAGNLESPKRVEQVLAHEAIGHFGLADMLGPQEFDRLRRRVNQLERAGNKRIRALHNRVLRRVDGHELSEPIVASEILAYLAEARVDEPALKAIIRSLRAAVRRFLRKLGFTLTFNDSDVDILITQAGRYVRETDFAGRPPPRAETLPKFARASSPRVNVVPTERRYGGKLYRDLPVDVVPAKGEPYGQPAIEILPGGHVRVHWDRKGTTRSDVQDLVREAIRSRFYSSGPAGEYWRFTNNKNEIADIEAGAFTRSLDHSTGAREAGISVASGAHYGVRGYKYGYRVSGEVLGEGADGEPLLNPATMVPLSAMTSSSNIVGQDRKRNRSFQDEAASRLQWTADQIQAGYLGGIELVDSDEFLSRYREGGSALFSRQPRYEGGIDAPELTGEARELPQGVERTPDPAPVGDTWTPEDLGPRDTGPGGPDVTGPSGDYTAAEQAALAKIGVTRKSISARERMRTARDRAKLKIRQGLVDQYAAIQEYGTDIWKLARLTHTAGGAVETLLVNGKVFLNDDGVIDTDTTGQGLAAALRPLGPEVDRFLAWVAGNRAAKLKEQERENLFTDADIAALVGLNRDTMPDGRVRSDVYASALSELNAFQKSVLDVAEKTGLINSEERATWDENFYVPFYRFMEATNQTRGPVTLDGLTSQTAFKRLKGGEDPLQDLLGNILMNWTHLLSASLKNQAAVRTLSAAEELGAATKVSKAEAGPSSVWARVDGQRVYYDVSDMLLLDAITSLNWDGFNNWPMKAVRKFKRAFTFGTTLAPAFRIANLLRDTVHAVAVTPLSYNILRNVTRGAIETGINRQVKSRMMAGGGEMHFGHLLGADPEAARLAIKRTLRTEEIIDTPEKLARVAAKVRKPLDWWTEVGSRAENINRAALYVQTLERTGSHLEATFQARDLMDFSQHGSWTLVRFLSQAVPFLNARLQGLDKTYRAAKDPRQRAQLAVMLGAVIMADVLLWLWWRDDEDYKAREEWDKDFYYWAKLPGLDNAVRVPKPFEVGLVGTLGQRLVEGIEGSMRGQPGAAKLFTDRLSHAMAETLAFNPTPQVVAPIVELAADRDFFTDRPIEGPSLERVRKETRAKPWTSPTAQAVSKGMAAATGGNQNLILSPVQIEHLVNGYLGWLGATGLATLDVAITGPLTDAPASPTWRSEDWPVLGRFVREAPARNTKYATLFYDYLNEAREAHATVRHLQANMGEPEAARALVDENRDILKTRRYLERQSKVVGDINKRLRRVRMSKALSPQEKRERIDRITERRNRVMERVVERVHPIFADR